MTHPAKLIAPKDLRGFQPTPQGPDDADPSDTRGALNKIVDDFSLRLHDEHLWKGLDQLAAKESLVAANTGFPTAEEMQVLSIAMLEGIENRPLTYRAVTGRTKASSENGKPMPLATIYATFTKLLNRGWIRERDERDQGDKRMRSYEILAEGKLAVRAQALLAPNAWPSHGQYNLQGRKGEDNGNTTQ